MNLQRVVKYFIPNYRVKNIREWLKKGVVEMFLEKDDQSAPMSCSVCGYRLGGKRGSHKLM